MATQKLYCYVDETGQDTKGKLFLVTVVLKGQDELDSLKEKLNKIEKSTDKNLLKWTKSPFRVRNDYLIQLIDIKELKSSIFYSTYQDTKAYVPLTSSTIAKSVLAKEEDNYTVNIVIDGLKGKEQEAVRKDLKKLKIHYNKIRGMKDEQDVVLRLADSIAGFLRDYLEKQSYAQPIFKKFKEKNILIEV